MYTQYSIIPFAVQGKLHPSGVNSKPGPLGPDLYTVNIEWTS
ncbi:hypothetical protein D1AOALGA4SA_740 [Olavius algarvensis Delta 1 endosymbiont]|nr:hypothetical protein D1AOALGA4SA_740 [Olavius algarvensis Delta 1 endosymbiont]